uniref:Uncharacterized protein n=1 Tax=Anopheles christyi TaxID=43041 RepID=A0A182K2B6_9DIPT
MVHSGALVSHYLLRPSYFAAAVAAAPFGTVLLDHHSSSRSSIPLPRLLSEAKPSERALFVSSPLVSSPCLSSNVWLSQPKSMSILIVLKGGQSPQRYSREEATRKKGRLIYEAHSPYRSVAVRPSKIDRGQQRSRLLESQNKKLQHTTASMY